MSNQLQLDVAQLTDVGRKRPHNEDNMAYVIPKDPQVMARKGALFIVADGMGGHAAGEVASEIAVDTVSNTYYQDDTDDIVASLIHAIKRANTLIHQRAAENMLRSGMGTTCIAAVMRGGTAYIANVGDSRTYLVRRGEVRQISQDHSWVEEQVRAGLLTREQARSHAQRNVITRCLGTQADVEVDIFTEVLEEGDYFILCSDGLSGLVSDDDLRMIVDQYVPQESVYHLVERANDNGGPDNITAIVIRVQEVGWEPPTVRHNGHLNGKEVGEDTIPNAKTLEMAPLQVVNGHVPSTALRLPTGPLQPSESVTDALPTTKTASRKRGRLLYPTLIIFILLAVTLVGSGAYYLLHLNATNFDSSLRNAQSLVRQAQNEVDAHQPAQALEHLASAQNILRTLQNTSLSDAQHRQVSILLNGVFLTTVKDAIASYNTQASTYALPCTTTISKPISNGSTNTQASSIATLETQEGKGPPKQFSYVLGDDHNLYQLGATQSLVNKFSAVPTSAHILKIASDGAHLLILTATQGSTPASYSLALLTPNDTGVLTETSSANIDPKLIQADKQPTQLTAWGQDVYVLLTSDTAQTSATILAYTLKNTTFGPPSITTISAPNVVGMVAFPSHQLFLVANGGQVQSLVLGATSLTPIPVQVTPAVVPTLGMGASDYTVATPVPQPTAQPTSSSSPDFLQVPSASLLVAGNVAGGPHLYIVDSFYHRVLDLEPKKQPAAITPSATRGTKANTGASSPVLMQLDRQYSSASLLQHVKGMVAVPNTPLIYLLAQDDQASVTNLLSVDTSLNHPCSA